VTTVHTITVLPEGRAFRCAETRSVLHGMEQAAATGIQVGCRSGGCGVCRVQVVAGTFTARRMSKAHVTEEDIARGLVLACRIHPTSDLTVEWRPRATAPEAAPTGSVSSTTTTTT
jgi:ferredoxin